MNQKVIEEIRLPKYREIPNVGLYLEQTVKYINECLEPIPDLSVTSSMISNYVKQKLISHPVRKQYDREQIAYLLFTAIAKSVISLDNIRKLINLQQQTYHPEEAFDYFCDELEMTLAYVFKKTDSLREITAHNQEEKLLVRSLAMTVANKIYLDHFFASIHTNQ